MPSQACPLSGKRTRRTWARLLAFILVVLTGVAGGCPSDDEYAEYDQQATEEAAQCTLSPASAPPPGSYQDRGIQVPWGRLMHSRDRRTIDQASFGRFLRDPDNVEQLYYDASQGDARAAYAVCQVEAAARLIGRNLARYLTDLKCTAIVHCDIDFKKLPLSDETASGTRLLTFIGKELEVEAARRGAWQELIGYALVLAVGPRIPRRIRPKAPVFIPGARGPGRWVKVNESMPARARAYQERITRHTSTEAYEVSGVKFDGYRKGVLLEAKGPGYAKFVDNGDFRDFFSGRQSLLDQARHQATAANRVPVEWHVAEQEVADLLRRTFDEMKIPGIRVIHSP